MSCKIKAKYNEIFINMLGKQMIDCQSMMQY